MSKLEFIMKFKYLLILIILLINIKAVYSSKYSDLIWIEGIPIFSKAIINKKDAIEFDSSYGKIIIVHLNSKKNQLPELFEFYNRFFEDKKWINIKKNTIWEKKVSKLTKKSFSIEVSQNKTLTLKIITQNF